MGDAELTRRRTLVRTQHRPLTKSGILQVKYPTGKEARDRLPGPLTATVLQPVSKGVFEGSAAVVLPVGDGERVGVEGDGYGAMAEVFLERSWGLLLW